MIIELTKAEIKILIKHIEESILYHKTKGETHTLISLVQKLKKGLKL